MGEVIFINIVVDFYILLVVFWFFIDRIWYLFYDDMYIYFMLLIGFVLFYDLYNGWLYDNEFWLFCYYFSYSYYWIWWK